MSPRKLGGETVRASLVWTTSGVFRAGVEQKEEREDNAAIVLADLEGFELYPGDVVKRTSSLLKFDRPCEEEMGRTLGDDGSSYSLGMAWYVASNPEGGYLLAETPPNNWIHFINENGEAQCPSLSTRGILEDDQGLQHKVTAVWRAIPVADGIFAVVETELVGDKPHAAQTSFLYIDRTRPRAFQPFDVEKLFRAGAPSLSDLRKVFFSKDFSLTVAIGDSVFALMLHEMPWIARIDIKNPEEIVRLDLPEDLRLKFVWPQSEEESIERLASRVARRRAAMDRYYAQYRSAEGQRMPYSLFEIDGRLFLLIKSAMDERSGHTSWETVELNQSGEASQVGPLMHLPVESASVSVIPGKKTIALLEKSRIQIRDMFPNKVLKRRGYSATLLPADWFSEKVVIDRKKGVSCENIPFRSGP